MSLQSPQILNLVGDEQADRFFWIFIFLLSDKTRVVAGYHGQECVSEASLSVHHSISYLTSVNMIQHL